MPEWLMGADCKFAGLYLRRFESCSAQKLNNYSYIRIIIIIFIAGVGFEPTTSRL